MANMGKPDITNCLPCINLFKFTLVCVTGNKKLERGFSEKAFQNMLNNKRSSSFVQSHQIETQQARGPLLLLIKASR